MIKINQLSTLNHEKHACSSQSLSSPEQIRTVTKLFRIKVILLPQKAELLDESRCNNTSFKKKIHTEKIK